MNTEDFTSISLVGKFSSYQYEEYSSTPINIEEVLAGKTSFCEEVYCEELYLKAIDFDIFIHDEERSIRKKVGSLFGRLFDIDKCREDEFDQLEVFDEVDQHTFDVYDLGRKKHEGILSDNIFSIESLMIYPEYRNKSIGTAALHILTDVIEVQFNTKVGCIIVAPEPRYDIEREEKPQEELFDGLKDQCERFFENLGFERINDEYWYFNVDNRMLVKGKNPLSKDIDDSHVNDRVAESAIIYEFPSPKDKKNE